MNKIAALSLVVLISLFVSSCSALGYVPKADLDAAVLERDGALERVNALDAQAATFQDQLEEAKSEQERLQEELSRYGYLVCQTHDWDDAMQANGFFPLIGADEFIHPDFQNYVFFTQWDPDFAGPAWQEGLPVSTLLLDLDGEISMIFDTEEDCVVLNPAWWNSLDHSPSGSAQLIND